MPTLSRRGRWFTSKIVKDGGYNFAVDLMPSEEYPPVPSDEIDDNDYTQIDEVTKTQGSLTWTGGKPDSIPVDVQPNFWDEEMCAEHSPTQGKTWDYPFWPVTLPTYTDHGFFKGNMFGNMSVEAACNVRYPVMVPYRKAVDRDSSDDREHVHADPDPKAPAWEPVDSDLVVTLADIVKVGRLEADGCVTQGATGDPFEDKSSRDRFPDIAGANVYDYEVNVGTEEAPVMRTYVRTYHEGQAGMAEPVPVHITFRAAPGEMDLLLTWNCAHLAGARIAEEIRDLMRLKGYDPPVVTTPEGLMEIRACTGTRLSGRCRGSRKSTRRSTATTSGRCSER